MGQSHFGLEWSLPHLEDCRTDWSVGSSIPCLVSSMFIFAGFWDYAQRSFRPPSLVLFQFHCPHQCQRHVHRSHLHTDPGFCSNFSQDFLEIWMPAKMIYFAWLLFNNKNLTWDNLRKRSWHGPSRWSICETDEETNFHIFFCCRPTQDIWYELARLYNFPHVFFDTVQATFFWWSSQCANRRPLLIITVWRWRNHKIFDSLSAPLNSILPCICSLYDNTSNRT